MRWPRDVHGLAPEVLLVLTLVAASGVIANLTPLNGALP